MVLKSFWGSLELLLNALGGLLGGFLGSSGVLLGPLRGLLGSSGGLLGACWGRLWGFAGSLFATSVVLLCFEYVFSPLRSSWGRFWASQLTVRPSKTRFLLLSIHSAHSTRAFQISRRILLLLLLRGLLLLPLPFESARRNARSD